MERDIVEMPVQRCLYRQSSLETRLSPQPPLDCSDSEEDTPKVIGVVQKKPFKEAKEKDLRMEMLKNELKDKFKNQDTPSSENQSSIPVYAQVNKGDKNKSYANIENTYYSATEDNKPSINSSVPVYAQVNKENKDETYDNIENTYYITTEDNKPSINSPIPVYAQVNKENKWKNDPDNESLYYSTVEDVKPQVAKPKILPKPSVARISQSFDAEEEPFVPVYADVTPPRKPLQNETRNSSIYESYRGSLYDEIQPQGKYERGNIKQEELNVTEGKSQFQSEPQKSTTGSSVSFAVRGTGDTVGNMATLRPKSPRPPVAKQDKEESLWDKIGTLGRKKRIKEVREVEAEGKNAIDSPGNPVMPDYPPEEYELDEKEERCMVDAHSLEEPKVRDLIQILIDWINDELAEQRIIVQDITDDLYDGQVLQKLLEKLTGDKLNEPEVTQSEEGQKHKLAMVLDDFNRILGIPHHSVKKWGVESIHSKNIVAILYLLVALARHFRAPIRLPEHVTIKTHVVQKNNGQLIHRTIHEHVTSAYDDVGMRCERDAFDALFDHAPDKLQVVKKSMVTFVNKHLNKINLEVTDLDTQFSDGVYLVLLMGLLEGFFVPLHCFALTPKDFDQKVHNVAFAFDLMEEVGISRPKARPEDIVNLDLKSTLRVLYKLFSKYKDIV